MRLQEGGGAAIGAVALCLLLLPPAGQAGGSLQAPSQAQAPAPQAAQAHAAAPAHPGSAGSPDFPSSPASPGSQGARAIEQGVTIEAAVTPVEGERLVEGGDARFRFRLSDAGGTPVAGAYPAAWLDRPSRAVASCEARVKELTQENLFSRSALDLNVYYVITLNDDATLSVVDPLFGYGGTKLLAMVQLAARGQDWALAERGRRLFVSLPAADKVAVIDTNRFAVVSNLGSGPHPDRVVLQPDGGYLWVTWDGGVDAFDPRTLARVAHLTTGAGPHDLAFSDDSRFAFVTNRDAGNVTLVDVAGRAVAATLAVGRRPQAVAWSRQAQLAYVADEASGTIFGVAPPVTMQAAPAAAGGKGATAGAGAALVRARIAVDPGVVAIAFPPDGRFGIAANPATDQVYILDTAANRVAQTAHVQGGPDQVTFSADLAYLRLRRSETVLTLPLKSIGQAGTPVTVMDVPAGQHPLGQGAAPSPAASIVRAPGAAAVLIANPGDQAVYYYQEGMAAPMGSFNDFDRQPRAVLVLDRTLHETAPGTYETIAKLPAGGRYQLAFFMDAPRLVHCFDVEVEADPQAAAQRLAAQPPRVEYLVGGSRAAANRPFALRFRLLDAVSGAPIAGLADVQVLFYSPPGTNQRTVAAHAVAPGEYAADLDLGAPGAWSIYVQSGAARLPFHRSPVLVVQALPPAQPTAPTAPTPPGAPGGPPPH